MMALVNSIHTFWDRLTGRVTTVKSRPGWFGEDADGRATLSDGTPIQLILTPGCRCTFCKSARR